ncbi:MULTISPECIES: oxidoreductase [Kitasatospora]|uniref:NAD(P)-dependent dehydrogenase (Short-subunit alcohol dehydrogenase family) n=2 Tax=Kitasatospora TaxID=2063 RepID=A0ABT1JAL2_9ACTN|nr:oxidoreductase [Kitasatospora paracochleata]MCP2314492.1 NAD(P)-dependent dehydrogenase (short-subunit alcohol dehydrogenase family) [Kitasatospora paracochleata]
MDITSERGDAGRIWLITGANSGFGRAIAQAALDAGDTVVAAARRPETLAQQAAEHPGRLVPVRLDVTDAEQIPAVVADTIARYGRIDVLVNNAGRGLIGAVEETTDDELRDLMELHFFGPAALTRAVLPHMREQGTGAVVQLSSMGGRMSFPGVGAYSATKFALEGLSEALAQEVAGFGIKVLVVEPGSFRTGFAGPGALAHSAPIAAYTPLVGPVRDGLPDSDGKQAGDPVKAAAAILTALEADRTPLRLALGGDAVDAVRTALQNSLDELEAWEKVGRATGFPDGA